jgi:hypothetical protein
MWGDVHLHGWAAIALILWLGFCLVSAFGLTVFLVAEFFEEHALKWYKRRSMRKLGMTEEDWDEAMRKLERDYWREP